jgi:hypothetical protein
MQTSSSLNLNSDLEWVFFQRYICKGSWLQIHRSRFDSRRCQIIWELVDLERGPLSLVTTIAELLERKSCGSGLESREYCRRDPSRWLQKLALTSPASGCRSVGIVRSRTKATEFFISEKYAEFSEDVTCFRCCTLTFSEYTLRKFSRFRIALPPTQICRYTVLLR